MADTNKAVYPSKKLYKACNSSQAKLDSFNIDA